MRRQREVVQQESAGGTFGHNDSQLACQLLVETVHCLWAASDPRGDSLVCSVNDDLREETVGVDIARHGYDATRSFTPANGEADLQTGYDEKTIGNPSNPALAQRMQ